MRSLLLAMMLLSSTAAAQATSPAATSAPAPATPQEHTIYREVFEYSPAGRRDPFASLLATSDLRPLLIDLRLAAIAYDPNGRNSVAVLRDLTSKEQYRVKVGQTLGRMRVAAIQPRSVTFTIQEFGLSRQETLTMNDTTRVTTP
ncbi:MAG TPA: hypothetical protein VMY38_01845 [Gemmatimonadaceae bacterium]|nr:hypothetical protein [Gemmatimonadaceae bacterium]